MAIARDRAPARPHARIAPPGIGDAAWYLLLVPLALALKREDNVGSLPDDGSCYRVGDAPLVRETEHKGSFATE